MLLMEVNGADPWMSHVSSLKTVSNMLMVTKRTPRSIRRLASRHPCPKRFMPYFSRIVWGSWPSSKASRAFALGQEPQTMREKYGMRSEEHTSELQSLAYLV